MSEQMPDSSSIEAELQKFPVSVVAEYRKAAEAAARNLEPQDFEGWAREGIAIAQHSFRSWEAATEYFRATPSVVGVMAYGHLIGWARWGRTLAADSPVIAAAFFKATPEVIHYLPIEQLGHWAGLGRGLYKGTWKSSTLASTYFDVTPRLLRTISMDELDETAQFIEGLAQRSYDAATECLQIAEQVFAKVEKSDRKGFLSLAVSLAKANWRDVKPFFENGARALAGVEKSQRSRFLALAERLPRETGANVIPFLLETSSALSEMDQDTHPALLGMAERLVNACPQAVSDFLRNAPKVQARIKDQQLARWFDEGMRILEENEDGGLAFFRMESARGERVVEALSSGVALDRVKELLMMYCRALAGESVDLMPTQDLKEKNIGWNSAERATTEGKNIFVPSFVERYPTKDENFNWFKVIVTHQVGHLEFGSFAFLFDKPSTVFLGKDQREVLSKETQKPKAAVSDLQRFFDLFPDRKLASDIFMLVEDGRIDHLVKGNYRGIRTAYDRVQGESVAQRPSPDTLPLREALMEVLVRLSLQSGGSLSVPSELHEHIDAIAMLMRGVQADTATVEDTAETALRIYEIVSQVPNVESEEERSDERKMDEMGDEQSDEALEKLMQELQAGGSGSGQPPQGKQREYKSPQQVEFRGDFKPELVQALKELRKQKSKPEGQMQMEGISQEALKQMLEQSAELEMTEAQEGEVDDQASNFVDNLMSEAADQQAKARPGNQFPHVPEDDRPLSSNEPKTFLYDEWDFRAADYKPRWCAVREKVMDEGTSDFYEKTLKSYAQLVSRIKKQFEMLAPEMYRKVKHLPDGDEYDFDTVVESVIEGMAGGTPTDKVYWRRNKIEREVSVAFLLDMSASTAEAVDEARRQIDTVDFPDDPRDYMTWLRTRREEMSRRTYKRIIDIEKESTVLLIRALEAIGDTYGIYGFSGYGRENVEFYVIKDIDERFGEPVKRRIDKITPMHATRMGPAIRHAVTKLESQESRTKVLFLVSDGRPQDRGYSREGVEKEYAVHDTRMALNEARRKNIVPFCLTVDRAGHDYLKTMCSDMGYEIVPDITSLPHRLPQLYRRLTV
ncbi:MAG: VWA domain-containing protein [Chloroflexi bacterium]|nr:VWA domain-containing protein [Chloroflexota bacterium]